MRILDDTTEVEFRMTSLIVQFKGQMVELNQNVDFIVARCNVFSKTKLDSKFEFYMVKCRSLLI